MTASDVKTIVVLGAGPAAMPVIRQTMVNNILKRDNLKMVLVSPTSDFYWPIAIPRVIVPDQIPDEKVSIPLAPTFANYPPSKFEFILGKAASLDPASNTVSVKLNTGGTHEINYHTLIIATGARAKDDMPWKALATTEQTKDKLHRLQEQVKNADTIVVAGGGLTGAETAGELGFEYSQHGKKEVILIHTDNLPFSDPVITSVRQATKNELEKLNVKLIPNTIVTNATVNGTGTVLELRAADGTTRTITAQAYLPTTGIIPNTEFAPKNLLNAQGYIKQTARLQAEGHKNIFVIGDVGALEPSTAAVADAQAIWLIKNLPLYINGSALPEYQASTKPMFGITLGRSRATGQMGTIKLFSFLIWFMKGRYLGTDYAHLWAAGKRTISTTFEK
ncbi:Apoptosis-inducing factor 2 [Ilyonectria robusta]